MAYLNAMIGNKSLEEYVYDKIPENKKQDYDSSILMIYNYKKFENGSKIFYGEVCKTCNNSNPLILHNISVNTWLSLS